MHLEERHGRPSRGEEPEGSPRRVQAAHDPGASGEVAFFLVKKEEWALSFHIQVFEGPAAAWLVADLLPPRQQTPPVARGTEGPTIGSSNQFQIGLIFEGQTFIEVGEPTPTKYNTKIIFGRSYDTEKNLWKINALQEVLDKVDP